MNRFSVGQLRHQARETAHKQSFHNLLRYV